MGGQSDELPLAREYLLGGPEVLKLGVAVLRIISEVQCAAACYITSSQLTCEYEREHDPRKAHEGGPYGAAVLAYLRHRLRLAPSLALSLPPSLHVSPLSRMEAFHVR